MQRVLFELFVLLANLDQFRQLIMALLEQHINVGPSLGDTMFECNQTVIERDAKYCYNDDCADKSRLPMVIDFSHVN